MQVDYTPTAIVLGLFEYHPYPLPSSGGGGVGVLRHAATFSAFAAAASKNSNDERQRLIFFLDRGVVDEAVTFLLAGVIGGALLPLVVDEGGGAS